MRQSTDRDSNDVRDRDDGQTCPPNQHAFPGPRPLTAEQPFRTVRDFASLLDDAVRESSVLEIAEWLRRGLTSDLLCASAEALCVPEDFLERFRPGWSTHLRALTFLTFNADGEPDSIETVPIGPFNGVIRNTSTIAGRSGLITPIEEVRPGAPLELSSDFETLHQAYLRGSNCAWYVKQLEGRDMVLAVDEHARRLKAPRVIHDSDRIVFPQAPGHEKRACAAVVTARLREKLRDISRRGRPTSR